MAVQELTQAPKADDQSLAQPPSLWPKLTSDDLLVAPIFNGTFWLAMVKANTPTALRDDQKESLRQLGFREGSQGRWIYPARVSPETVERIARIVEAPLDVTEPEQYVFLKPGATVEPAVPLDIQAGIRWFWKNQPQSLLTEIQTSLDGREDELSRQTLDATVNQRLQNSMRIQRWVALALSGEISPVTEPILGLGLQKAGQAYGTFDQWPEYLKEWHRKLADERGEAPVDEESLTHAEEFKASLTPDDRPPIGEVVSWTIDGQSDKGVVVDHDPSDTSILWVSSANLKPQINGIYFPSRTRIAITNLNGVVAPQTPPAPTEQPQAPEAPAETFTLKPVSPDLLKPQRELTVSDLDPRYQAMVSRGAALSPESMVIVEMMYRSGYLRGHSPLAPANNNENMISYWYGRTRDIVHSRVGDALEVEATLLIRNAILDDFNAAQPSTANGETPALAVLPLPELGAQPIEDHELVSPRILEALRESQFCRIGIHPAYATSVRDAMLDWAEAASDHLKERDPELLSSLTDTAKRITTNTLYADGLSLGASTNNLRTKAEALLSKSPQEVRKGSVLNKVAYVREHLPELVEHSGFTLFTDYKRAGDWINGLDPRVAEVTERNERLLSTLGELTNTAAADIEKTPHPVFAMIDALHEHGLPKCSKAQALALLNCDLSQNMNWLGQLASLNGARIPMTHLSSMQQASPDDPDILEKEGTFHYVDASYTTTGWLQTGDTSRPFQITLAARTKDLSLLASRVGSAHQLRATNFAGRTMFQQEDAGHRGSDHVQRYASLGRLIDLHANHGIEFGPAFDGEVIPEETLDHVPMNLFTLNHLGEIGQLNQYKENASICVEPLQKLPEMPSEPIGDLDPSTLTQHCRGARSALLTLTPSWRNQSEPQNQMREALRFWVDDQKHLKALRDPASYVDKLELKLIEDPDTEMLLVATKQTTRRIFNEVFKITRDDIIHANNDRALAIEHGVLKMKAQDQSLSSGWRFAAFDAATVMRPQALRVLNERREALRRAREGSPDATEANKGRRGKRQDKGVVAGLSIKDLRGKTTTVLSNLRHASSSDQGRYITKTKLWEAPDWISLRHPDDLAKSEGERAMEPLVAAFFDYARKQLPSQPPANIPQVNQAYAELVLALRDGMADIRTDRELRDALGMAERQDDDTRGGYAPVNSDGALAKAVNRAKEFCDREHIPYHLMFGSDGLYSSFPRKIHYTSWYRKAERESRTNTHWSIDTSGASSQRRVANKDETGAMPMLQALVRSGGEDYRAGTDIDEQSMLTTFGFSGVEYGKSMTQADRTAYLNQAYDGFMDLAKALNIPPKALSLGGTLGLAFGSRGRGGRNAALAHFEPTNNVINLTRMKGAGSMSHEYGHALANYFYRLSKGTPGDRNPGDITEVLARQIERDVREPTIVPGNLRNPVAEAIAVVMQSIQYNLPPKTDSQGLLDNEGYSLSESGPAITGTYSPERSPLVEGARLADRARSTPYWGTPEELFARSFETWIHETLRQKNPDYRNDFLVRPDKLSVWGTPIQDQDGPTHRRKAQLYPSGDQLKAVDQAFQKLFRTVQHRDIEVNHEHLGKISLPILYSHDTGSIYAVTQREHSIIAECVMNEVARMCGDQVWVQWQEQILDGTGSLAAGRYRDLPAGESEVERKVRGVIDLAYGTRMGTAFHEAFHFAQSVLITETEQAMLDRSFSVGSPLYERLCQKLEDTNKANLIPHCDNPKEAQAHAYELWVTGKLNLEIQEQPSTLFGRVKRFLGKIANLGKQSGFQTPDQLFRAFYQGQLAERARINLNNEHAKTPTTGVETDTDRPLDDAGHSPIVEPEAAHSERLSTSEDTEMPALR